MEDIGKYKQVLPYHIQTAYIPLDDENLIAIDIITEKGAIIERPTFLGLGYRWKDNDTPKKLNPLIQEGFNIVIIDVRGVGASSGTRNLPWSRIELEDSKKVVDWIIQQPWSNRKIITFGSDYAATTSELSASLNLEQIQCFIIFGNPYDLYSELLFPGGIFLEWFTKTWNEKNKFFEQHKVKPVNDPLYHPILSEIKQQHQWNVNTHELFSKIEFKDDKFDSKPDCSIQNISVMNYSDEISRNKSPKFVLGSWFDGKSALSVIHRFLNYSNPLICVIGSWDHSLRPVKSVPKLVPHSIPSELPFILEQIRFAKQSISNPNSIPKLLYYFTIGEQKWKVTDTWPLPETEYLNLYFGTKHKLTTTSSEEKGDKTEYRVNFNTSTGKKNRWRTYFGSPVDYSDRAKQDKKLQTFTSSEFNSSVEVTGHPIVTLQISSSHEDGAIFVYLEAIHKRKVYYLSEGQIRLPFWKESNNPPYATPIPYRSFERSSFSEIKTNRIYDIRIPLEPISVRLPENHKIRVCIAGADAENFKNYPDTIKPHPTWSIYHNSEYTSFIQLPIIKLKQSTKKNKK
ncbi:MAG: CocE/NonD family hydrolase [Promethearchaeota archaeon]|nr:MAG: CocE/NonD family hydrolase [Candidatus Lokiarchaeota archaeon]